jgi:hypothetical protein
VRAAELLKRAAESSSWTSEVRRKAIIRKGGNDIATGNHQIHSQLALTYLQLGQWPEMRAAAAEVQRVAPALPGGYLFAGVAEANAKNFEAAVVQLIAAFIQQPGDQEVVRNLATCYEGLGIRPSPFTAAPDGSNVNINVANPLVRRHVNEAAAWLVRSHRVAGLQGAASTLRDSLIRQFQVPAEVLDTPAPPRSK